MALTFLELDEKIQILDVGAFATTEVPIYKTLLDHNLAHLNAFEGDKRQIQEIKKIYGKKVSIFNDFLFDGTKQIAYFTSPNSGMTSLLKPKTEALNFFNGFNQFGAIESTETIQTKTLDSIDQIPNIDFIKMDIQGAELTVLKNGLEKIKYCIGIQLEVSHICLYENQPPFGEVDVWLRSKGFVPHTFLNEKRWSITPTIFGNNFRIAGNQLLESDVIYVKDPLNLLSLSDKQLKYFAILSHHCFSSPDLCIYILIELVKRRVINREHLDLYCNELNKNTNK